MQAKAKRGEPVDFIADFAYPLPASVIMDLLGVPRADLERVKVWSDDIALFIGTAQVAGNKYLRAETGAKAMSDYFRGLVEARTAEPTGRHDQPARAGARRPRCAVDRRDHRHLYPAPVRRPRDHDQPHRQRLPLFDEEPRAVGTPGRAADDGRQRDRGMAALRRPLGRLRARRRRRPRDGRPAPSAKASASLPS